MGTKRELLLLFVITIFFNNSFAQSYSSRTLQYRGDTRQYQIYVPASYDGASSVPLLFNFHGGSDVIANQISIADMSPIADTADFILVYPQALSDPNDGGSNNWIHKSPTDIDDVFFIDLLIDTLAANYNIDLTRVYACGYSLGGEFTFELACRLNNRIAAIAVVARTMGVQTLNHCAPVHPTGVLTILGTSDQTSNYNGVSWAGVKYYLSADEVHDYWVNHNNCNPIPIISAMPNTNSSDGSTVEKYVWLDENACSYVQQFKVIGGGHDWPGTYGNMDINATKEVWDFVSRYDMDGLMACSGSTSVIEVKDLGINYTVYPNPFVDELVIETNFVDDKKFEIFKTSGELVIDGQLNSDKNNIDLSFLEPNIYVLKFGQRGIVLLKRE